MKKIVSLLVALVSLLFVCSAYAAESTVDDYMGIWVNLYDTKDGGASGEVIYIREDHKVFYVNQSFTDQEAGFGRQYVGSWDVRGNCIHIIYGTSAESDVYMSNDGFLLIPLGGDKYIAYGKAPVWGEAKQAQDDSSDAVIVPVGEYLIGQDIPAGRYTIEVDPNTSVATFEVKQNEESSSGKTYWLGSVYGGTTANVTLKEGNVLIVPSKEMKIMPAKSLFE